MFSYRVAAVCLLSLNAENVSTEQNTFSLKLEPQTCSGCLDGAASASVISLLWLSDSRFLQLMFFCEYVVTIAGWFLSCQLSACEGPLMSFSKGMQLFYCYFQVVSIGTVLIFIYESEVSFRTIIKLLFCSFLGTEELQEGQVNGTDDGIFLSWEPRSIYDSYIIDWCNFPRLQPCDLQWKRFGPNISSAVISSGESQIKILSDCPAVLQIVGKQIIF